LGRVSFTDMEHMEVYDDILCRRLVSSYAGVKAVELHTRRPTDFDDPNINPRVMGSDWDEVMDLTLRLVGQEESAQVTLQEKAEKEAQGILGENWRTVETIAQALLRDRSLDSADLSRIMEEANCPRGEPVHEYELNKLTDRKWELAHQYSALIEEGRQDEAQPVGEELARVECEIKNLARSAESNDE
jgi:hypothetical protein